MSVIPPPPWVVAGITIDLIKDSANKTLTIAVAPGCFAKSHGDAIRQVLEFVEATRARFAAVVPPGWRVLA